MTYETHKEYSVIIEEYAYAFLVTFIQLEISVVQLHCSLVGTSSGISDSGHITDTESV